MIYSRIVGTILVAFGVLAAQQPVDDPVIKAQARRTGVGADQDLPPVPRTVMEPPPLPPPEVNIKDTRGYKAKKGKKGKGGAVKKSVKPGKGKKVGARKK